MDGALNGELQGALTLVHHHGDPVQPTMYPTYPTYPTIGQPQSPTGHQHTFVQYQDDNMTYAAHHETDTVDSNSSSYEQVVSSSDEGHDSDSDVEMEDTPLEDNTPHSQHYNSDLTEPPPAAYNPLVLDGATTTQVGLSAAAQHVVALSHHLQHANYEIEDVDTGMAGHNASQGFPQGPGGETYAFLDHSFENHPQYYYGPSAGFTDQNEDEYDMAEVQAAANVSAAAPATEQQITQLPGIATFQSIYHHIIQPAILQSNTSWVFPDGSLTTQYPPVYKHTDWFVGMNSDGNFPIPNNAFGSIPFDGDTPGIDTFADWFGVDRYPITDMDHNLDTLKFLEMWYFRQISEPHSKWARNKLLPMARKLRDLARPADVWLDEVQGDRYDAQGIDWTRLGVTRRKAREYRMRSYINYSNQKHDPMPHVSLYSC
jgi:hypothetical protein